MFITSEVLRAMAEGKAPGGHATASQSQARKVWEEKGGHLLYVQEPGWGNTWIVTSSETLLEPSLNYTVTEYIRWDAEYTPHPSAITVIKLKGKDGSVPPDYQRRK